MARGKQSDGLLVARQSLIVELPDGDEYPVLAGVTRAPASHPVVKARPDVFGPIDRPDEPPPQPRRSGR